MAVTAGLFVGLFAPIKSPTNFPKLRWFSVFCKDMLGTSYLTFGSKIDISFTHLLVN